MESKHFAGAVSDAINERLFNLLTIRPPSDDCEDTIKPPLIGRLIPKIIGKNKKNCVDKISKQPKSKTFNYEIRVQCTLDEPSKNILRAIVHQFKNIIAPHCNTTVVGAEDYENVTLFHTTHDPKITEIPYLSLSTSSNPTSQTSGTERNPERITEIPYSSLSITSMNPTSQTSGTERNPKRITEIPYLALSTSSNPTTKTSTTPYTTTST